MAAYLDIGFSLTVINNASKGLRQAADDVKRLGTNSQATANRLKAIQVVIAGILINKTLEYGRAITKIAADNQTLNMRLLAYTGSVKAADKVQSELNKTFAASGLVVDDVVQNFVKVNGAIRDTEKSVALVKAMGNAVLALGGGQEQLDNLSQAMAKISASGVNMKAANAVFANTSLVMGDLAKAAGKTMVAFDREVRGGLMRSSEFIDAFTKAANDKFANMAILMGSTIKGAMGKISNAWDQGWDDIAKRTNLNAVLVTIFDRIADRITKAMGSIDQAALDKIVNVFANMEQMVNKVGAAIVKIGGAILTVGSILAELIGRMPQESIEFGLLGYMILGKKGAVLGAIIGGINEKLTNISAKALSAVGDDAKSQEMRDIGFAGAVGTGLGGIFDLVGGAGKEKPGTGAKAESIFGGDFSVVVKKNEAAVADLMKTFAGAGKAGDGITSAMDDAARAAESMRESVRATVDSLSGSVALRNFRTSGDELGASIQQINNETTGWLNQIDKALLKFGQMKVHTSEDAALQKQLVELRQKITDSGAAAISQQERLNALTREQLNLETQSLQLENSRQIANLKRESDTSALGNLFSGGAGSLAIQVEERRLDLLKSVNDITKEISELNTKIAEDQKGAPEYQSQIDSLEKLRETTNEALNGLSAEGMLQKELWQGIGQTLRDEVGSAIQGLIEGTKTWGDVARSVFSSLNQLAINYLMKLVEIYLQQQLMNLMGGLASAGAGGLGGTGIESGAAPIGPLSFFGGSANGNAFNVGVKPFASGGIIGGPTLFGLAGEAGPEAIMPLTRIGGKLGVQSTGKPGNAYNITIQAIDTISGLEFLRKHIYDIEMGIGHRRMLNRAGRTMP